MKYSINIQNNVRSYFNICIFIFYLYTAYTWLYYKLPYSVAVGIFLSGVGAEGMINGFHTRFNRYEIGAVFSLLFYFAWDWLIGNGLDGILSAIPILILFLINRDDLKSSLAFITKWYAVLMVCSIFLYILGYIYQLPNIGVVAAPNYPDYYNCIVYLQAIDKFDLLFFRFHGPFFEPGHLAMASCFLVIANGLKFNKWLGIIYLSIILSFSLAGYLILMISILIFKVHNIKTVLVVGCCFIAVVACIPFIDEDNPFSKLIFSRLEYSEDKGIEGNNRFHGSTDKLFNGCVESMSIIHGLGEQTFKKYLEMRVVAGAGYKIYFLEKGIIGFLLVLGIYIYIGLDSCNRKYAFIYLLLILLAFLQRSYIISFSWIYPYYTAVLTCHVPKNIRHRREITWNNNSTLLRNNR